jgi:hypothetical protein
VTVAEAVTVPEITPVTTPEPVVVAVLVTIAVALPVATAVAAPVEARDGSLGQEGAMTVVAVSGTCAAAA